MKKSVRKSRKSHAPQSKPRIGIPTVKQRLDMIERAIVMAAVGLGVEDGDLSRTKPELQPVALHVKELEMIVRLLSNACEQVYFTSEAIPADALASLCPTEDQLKSFEPVELLGGAR